VEIEHSGRVRLPAKFSEAKVTYPGRKQVFRSTGANGKFSGDVIALEDEGGGGGLGTSEPPAPPPRGRALMHTVMRDGKRLPEMARGAVALADARKRCREELSALPAALLSLESPESPYLVHYSPKLESLLEKARGAIAATP
jgi:nicotinate phosphoribosyltransferase